MKIKDYIVPKTTASIILSQGIMSGTIQAGEEADQGMDLD